MAIEAILRPKSRRLDGQAAASRVRPQRLVGLLERVLDMSEGPRAGQHRVPHKQGFRKWGIARDDIKAWGKLSLQGS